ncbi:hypothetical protein [Photobacterium kasasachensis]|uniref:hypothetical protein n=1 Tax=Photobacterium kasasachensis TaxID=2910240 RepID=UPI003D0A5EFA
MSYFDKVTNAATRWWFAYSEPYQRLLAQVKIIWQFSSLLAIYISVVGILLTLLCLGTAIILAGDLSYFLYSAAEDRNLIDVVQALGIAWIALDFLINISLITLLVFIVYSLRIGISPMCLVIDDCIYRMKQSIYMPFMYFAPLFAFLLLLYTAGDGPMFTFSDYWYGVVTIALLTTTIGYVVGITALVQKVWR